MTEGTIARRYARALFGLAAETGKSDAWAASLARLGEALAVSPELREALTGPTYATAARRAVLAQLARALALDAEPAHLLELLCDRGRLAHLEGVIGAFTALADAAGHRVRARVTSAVALSAGERERLAEKLSRACEAQVLVEDRVDPALLGGVVAQVGPLTYDGSARTQLESLRAALKA